MESRCSKGHLRRWKCHENLPSVCQTCQREDERRQKELQAELERQAKRDREQAEHAAKMAELDRQIKAVRERAADGMTAEENARALEQKKRDLEAARLAADQALNTPAKATLETQAASSISSTLSLLATVGSRSSVEEKHPGTDQNTTQDMNGKSQQEWDRQKRVEGASNDAIDALMALTGLEDVKSKILTIKAKIETVRRQGTDMKNERLGLVLLGNPGTGRYPPAQLQVC